MNRATWMPEVDGEADVQPAPSHLTAWLEAVHKAAALYGVAPESILGKGRTERIILARRDAWWTLKEAGWNPQAIALASGFERSTVSQALHDFERITGVRVR